MLDTLFKYDVFIHEYNHVRYMKCLMLGIKWFSKKLVRYYIKKIVLDVCNFIYDSSMYFNVRYSKPNAIILATAGSIKSTITR